jgi:UDP-N-acetylglucosamine:LPS N-acetylglucosamine transferase
MNICIVCNRGGHLTEALQLLDVYQENDFFFVVPHNIRDEELADLAPVYFHIRVDANPFRFLFVFWQALRILLKTKPDIVLSTGTENAIPFFLWGKLMGAKTIYLESWCRITDLSVTGKLVYFWVDAFWVQWIELVRKYPRAEYHGSVI